MNTGPSGMFTVPSSDTKESVPSAVLTFALPTAADKTLATLLTLGSTDVEANFVNASASLPCLTSFCIFSLATPSNSFM